MMIVIKDKLLTLKMILPFLAEWINIEKVEKSVANLHNKPE